MCSKISSKISTFHFQSSWIQCIFQFTFSGHNCQRDTGTWPNKCICLFCVPLSLDSILLIAFLIYIGLQRAQTNNLKWNKAHIIASSQLVRQSFSPPQACLEIGLFWSFSTLSYLEGNFFNEFRQACEIWGICLYWYYSISQYLHIAVHLSLKK
jgi:hypothetical protein